MSCSLHANRKELHHVMGVGLVSLVSQADINDRMLLVLQFTLPVPVNDEYIKKIETWEKTVEVWDRDRVIVEDNWTPERLRALEVKQMLKV